MNTINQQVFDSPNIAGEFVALGDITVNQTLEPISTEAFFRLRKETLLQLEYIQPFFYSNVLSYFLKNRLIILSGGGIGFDKSACIRSLGRDVVREKKVKQLLELKTAVGTKNLLKELTKVENSSLIILDDLHPKLIQYDLAQLIKVINQKGHYVLIQTDIAFDHWEIPLSVKQTYWYDIPEGSLYKQEEILKYCVQQIDRNKKILLFEKDPAEVSPETPLFLGMRVADWSRRFDSPEKVDFFIRLWGQEQVELSLSKVEEFFAHIEDSESSIISKWFKSLSTKEQLIVLGASMLEGCYESQFFSLMSDVISDSWKYREQSLMSLDYDDLEFLLSYFKWEEVDGEDRILKGKFHGQRTEIIKAAWSTHRRHVLKSFPLFVKAVSNSLNTKVEDWEKFGSRHRRMVLRRVVGDTISDIGLISIRTVESTMLIFAGKNDDRLQRVAAKSLSRWREFEKEEMLFELIENWLFNEDIKKTVIQYVSQQQSNSGPVSGRVEDYVYATIILTLGYASEYDAPNNLDNRIVELFSNLAEIESEFLANRIEDALTKMVHHHVLQLKEILIEKFVHRSFHRKAIAKGLALSIIDYPEEVFKTVNDWVLFCEKEPSKRNQRDALTNRDKLLTMILDLFQTVDYQPELSSNFTLKYVFEVLERFIRIEGRKEVINKIKETGVKLLSIDWEESSKHVDNVFSEQDKNLLLASILESYRSDRAKIQEGDLFVKVKEDQTIYRSFINKKKLPLTNTEQVMYSWTLSDSKLKRSIGVMMFITMAAEFEKHEEPILDKVSATKKEEVLAEVPIKQRSIFYYLFRFIVLVFKTLFGLKRIVFEFIIRLLYGPFFWDLYQNVKNAPHRDSISVRLAMDKWKRSDHANLQHFGKLLNRFFG